LGKNAGGGSDHASFYARKVPVLFFCTGGNPDYHRPSDTVARINFKGLVKVSKLVYLTAARLASMEGRAKFRAMKTPGRRGQRGPRMGFMPDFGFQGRGARVAGISPETPASRAGLAEGDVIVGFKGKNVASMSDLFRLLSTVKPGEAVKVVYLRKGEKRTTTVRFEK
jgi:predicted metalloprotease with PDZ domain